VGTRGKAPRGTSPGGGATGAPLDLGPASFGGRK
jgi:hypothetical protein